MSPIPFNVITLLVLPIPTTITEMDSQTTVCFLAYLIFWKMLFSEDGYK